MHILAILWLSAGIFFGIDIAKKLYYTLIAKDVSKLHPRYRKDAQEAIDEIPEVFGDIPDWLTALLLATFILIFSAFELIIWPHTAIVAIKHWRNND